MQTLISAGGSGLHMSSATMDAQRELRYELEKLDDAVITRVYVKSGAASVNGTTHITFWHTITVLVTAPDSPDADSAPDATARLPQIVMCPHCDEPNAAPAYVCWKCRADL